MIILWLYYSKIYILGSILITLLLNKVFEKLYYAPLIINMVSVILLLMVKTNKTESMYLIYVPVVLTSVITNIVIKLIRMR